MPLKRITDLPNASVMSGLELVEVSQRSAGVSVTSSSISAANAGNVYSGVDFVSEGFEVNDRVNVTGFTTPANNLTVGIVTAVTATSLTIGGADGNGIVDEAAGSSVTISKWTSRRVSVNSLPGASGANLTVVNLTSGYTLTLSDSGTYLRINSSTGTTLTVPAAADVNFNIGTEIAVRQVGSGQVTITGAAGVTVLTAETTKLRKAGSAVSIVKVGTNVWDLTGDLELI